MLTNNDIEKLKEIFVTKQELRRESIFIIDTLTKEMMNIISPLVEKSQKNSEDIHQIKTHLRSI